jgi:hypothetical protein
MHGREPDARVVRDGAAAIAEDRCRLGRGRVPHPRDRSDLSPGFYSPNRSAPMPRLAAACISPACSVNLGSEVGGAGGAAPHALRGAALTV